MERAERQVARFGPPLVTLSFLTVGVQTLVNTPLAGCGWAGEVYAGHGPGLLALGGVVHNGRVRCRRRPLRSGCVVVAHRRRRDDRPCGDRHALVGPPPRPLTKATASRNRVTAYGQSRLRSDVHKVVPSLAARRPRPVTRVLSSHKGSALMTKPVIAYRRRTLARHHRGLGAGLRGPHLRRRGPIRTARRPTVGRRRPDSLRDQDGRRGDRGGYEVEGHRPRRRRLGQCRRARGYHRGCDGRQRADLQYHLGCRTTCSGPAARDLAQYRARQPGAQGARGSAASTAVSNCSTRPSALSASAGSAARGRAPQGASAAEILAYDRMPRQRAGQAFGARLVGLG